MMADVDVQSESGNDAAATPAPQPPLCVDLDGTLLATDSLWEALLLLARKHPADLARVPSWIAAGKAQFKDQLAERVKIDVTLLPYRQDIIDFIKAEKQTGRRIVLATASHRNVAEAIAAHLGLFDEVIGSDANANYKGRAKLAELERRYGVGNFDYVGDSTADIAIWQAARRAYIVDCGNGVLGKAEAVCKPYRVFAVEGKRKAFIKALRPHQWVKNLLIFIPLILGHLANNFQAVSHAVYAFWSFSFCASAIYIINDLLDLESDRRHATKRKRPFASGKLSAATGLAMSAVLLVVAFSITFVLPPRFAGWLAVYLVLTTAYSFWLKRKLLVDVILLAGLYTQRVIAGAAAVNLPPTMWLLAFSMFFFLSLAFAKRYSELVQVEDAGEDEVHGRGYQVRDLRVIESIGPSSGYLAVLVFCNYLDSPEVKALYRHVHVLWMVAPILLYWITRIWFIARRRQLHDDPIIFAIRDRRSHICGLLVAAIVVIARIWQ